MTTTKNQLLQLHCLKMSTKDLRRQKFLCITCGQRFIILDSKLRKKKTHTLKKVCSQCDNTSCSPIQPQKREIMCATCFTDVEKFRDIERAGNRIRVANHKVLRSIDNTIYNKDPNGDKLCRAIEPRIVSLTAGYGMFIKCYQILVAFGENLSLKQVHDRLTVEEEVEDDKGNVSKVALVEKDFPEVNHAKIEIQIWRQNLFESGSRLQI